MTGWGPPAVGATDLAEATRLLAETGAWMDRQGWVPATAGNLSLRLPDGSLAITRSGPHKGRLAPGDIIRVDLAGRVLDSGAKPSAETLLHCARYAAEPGIAAVLHGHSVAGTVLSRCIGGDWLVLDGFELVKAFGLPTHAVAARLALVDNDQDIATLAPRVEALLASDGESDKTGPVLPAYLIRGHGAYAWGGSLVEARHRLEALEFLLACALAETRAGQPSAGVAARWTGATPRPI